MNRDKAKEIAKEYIEQYLTSKGLSLISAFNCLNPNHEDKHPSMKYDASKSKFIALVVVQAMTISI